MDVDKDYPQIPEIKEGLHQYYDREKETDLFSLNTGRVFAKIGVNEKTDKPAKLPVSFVVVDNKPHLTESGIRYLAKKAKDLFIITANKTHPALSLKTDHLNVHVFQYLEKVDFADAFQKLYTEHGADRLTIQSGGTLNALLIREGLVDRVLLVVAPVLVGGKDTASLMDGESLHSTSELSKIKPLKLIQAKPLEHSYLMLEYQVIEK